MNFHGYALGFDIRDYRGHKIVMHTGGLPGYVSRVAMIPDLNVGVVVLTNQESVEGFDSIAYRFRPACCTSSTCWRATMAQAT